MDKYRRLRKEAAIKSPLRLHYRNKHLPTTELIDILLDIAAMTTEEARAEMDRLGILPQNTKKKRAA